MTRLQFVDGFWDSEFLGTRGYDILCQHLKLGRKMCKEIDDYIKERIKAEQTYSKALSNAVKKLTTFEDLGDLGKSVLQLQRETDKILNIHEIAAKQLLALQREISEFNNDQNNKRHSAEETIKKSNNAKQQAYKQAMSSKEKYIQKCRESDIAEDVFNKAKQSVTVKTKELEKIEKNKEKSFEAMENADQVYKQSINLLEQARVEWENDMEQTCEVFQNLEENEIEAVRDLIWRVSNVDSQACVDHDQCAENVRQKLEMCDIDRDIEEFIKKYKTGSERPAVPSQIYYENYYDKRSNTTVAPNKRPVQQTLTDPERNRERNLPPRPSDQPHVIPPRPSEMPRPSDHSHVAPPPRPSEMPRIVQKDEPLISFDDGNGHAFKLMQDIPETEGGYASINTVNRAEVRHDRVPCTIHRPYVSKKPTEHNVQVGEVVEIVREMPGTAMVQILKNGRIGLIPTACVQRIGTV